MKIFYFLAVITSLLFGQSMAIAEDGQLWHLADKDGVIKVFLSNFTNDSGQSQIMPEDFRKAVEYVLSNRKSVKFELVKSPGQSDVQIAAQIKQYRYLDRGPLKITPGIGTTLLDAAATATANYAEMAVSFMVIDTKTNAVLWNDTVAPYAKQGMSALESIPIIYEKAAKHFVWKCFGKPTN